MFGLRIFGKDFSNTTICNLFFFLIIIIAEKVKRILDTQRSNSILRNLEVYESVSETFIIFIVNYIERNYVGKMK